MLEFVDVSPEQPKSEALMRELTHQMLAGLREVGELDEVHITRNGNIQYRVK